MSGCIIGITRVSRPPAEDGAPPTDGPDGSLSQLVSVSGTKPQYTARRSTDARTALTRGLADYLVQLSAEVEERDVRLRRVLEHYAEPEERAVYPSACVYALGPGRYSPAFTPQVTPGVQVPGTDPAAFLVTTSELQLDMTVDVWTTDPVMRMAVCSMLEDGLNILDWRGGVLVELPHYYGHRASYDLLDTAYVDDDANASAGNWRAMLTVSGKVSVARLKTLPQARARARVTTTEDPL